MKNKKLFYAEFKKLIKNEVIKYKFTLDTKFDIVQKNFKKIKEIAFIGESSYVPIFILNIKLQKDNILNLSEETLKKIEDKLINNLAYLHLVS